MSRIVLGAVAALAVAAPAAAQAPDRTRPPEPGPPPALTLPAIQRVTLSNGLTLIHLPKRAVPLVQLTVLVRAGSVHEPAQRAGLASMTAAMLDEGAGTRTALALADAVEFLGASLSTGSDAHATRVSLNVPVAQLDPALELLADVVLRPTFDAEELERQRRQRLTAMAQWRDEPRAIASVAYLGALWGPEHPYGRMGLGMPAAVQAFTVQDLRGFHRAHYTPGNAAVIVVGDVGFEEIRAKLEAVFGRWNGESAPAPRVAAGRAAARRAVLLVDKPAAAQSEIRIGQIAVDRSTADYFPLLVMNTILGGSFSSRLNQKLREEKQYTYGARSGFDFGVYGGSFTASAAVQTAVTDSALVEFFRELRGILETAPDDEVARARNYAALRFPGRFQAVAQTAAELEDLYLFDLPTEYFNSYVQHMLAVTPADVRRVARRHLDPQRMTVVVVGDRTKVEAGIRGLNLGPTQVLGVADVLGPPPVAGSEEAGTR